jgi:hypothetical protein
MVDILTPVDLAQVFLWLQEKSLMGRYHASIKRRSREFQILFSDNLLLS